MTLHRRKVDDRTILQDGAQPLPVPAGWQIADGNSDDVRVCVAHAWQSDYLVFANGDRYRTSCTLPSISELEGAARRYGEMSCKIFASRLKTGKKVSSGNLQQDAQGVRATSGGMDVLLRRRA
jgi:hypothetical protein